MLKQLRIENFAIVKEAHLDFEKGLTIISGETGAGKSIIVDALTLISGGTADETLIKSDSDTAIVEDRYLYSKKGLTC